jgi:hypothetical protein
VLTLFKIWEEVKEMLLARFVAKDQKFLDGIALVNVHQESRNGSLKNYARGFYAKMVSCPKMNEYAKLVNFYRETAPESLDETLALADMLVRHFQSGGAQYQNQYNKNGKDSHQSKKKGCYEKGSKRKHEGEVVTKENDGKKKPKNPHHDNNTC